MSPASRIFHIIGFMSRGKFLLLVVYQRKQFLASNSFLPRRNKLRVFGDGELGESSVKRKFKSFRVLPSSKFSEEISPSK